ncbi:MAG: hypothetical protein V2A65_04865 [Candidatus Omnitrophota bacterium]
MKRISVCIALCILCMTVGSVHGQEYLFDFGPEDSALAEGFTRVTVGNGYSKEQGYGWTTDIPLYSRNENFSSYGSASLDLPPILADHVTGGSANVYPGRKYAFRVDLPAGRYLATLIMGKITESDRSIILRPLFFYTSYKVTANGSEILNVEQDWRSHMAAHYSRNEDDFLPGDSIYDKYVATYFRFHTFEFDSAGYLELALDAVCPLNGLLIYPVAQKREWEQNLRALEATNRSYLDNQFQVDYVEEEMDKHLMTKYAKPGAIMFSRPGALITPGSRPRAAEAGKSATDFLTPGDMGVLNVLLLPLRDMKAVKIDVSDLVSEAGNRITKDRMSIWLGRYMLVPGEKEKMNMRVIYYLPYNKPVDMISGATRMLNVYVESEKGTLPGVYRGEITVSSSDGTGISLALAVKVLPYKLDKPDMSFGHYTDHPWQTTFRFVSKKEPGIVEENKKLMRRLFEEMRVMGFNTSQMSFPWGPFNITEKGEITVNEPIWTLWKDTFTLYKETFGDMPMSVYGIYGHLFATAVPGYSNPYESALKYEEGMDYSDQVKTNMKKLIEYFYQQVKDNNWAPVLFYTSDEMSNAGEKGGKWGAVTARMYREIADQVGFRTIASMNGEPECRMLPYLDIAAINSAFPITEETIKKVKNAGCELWFYNLGADRFSYGYYLTKARPKGRMQWINTGAFSYLKGTPNLPSLGPLPYNRVFDSALNPGRLTEVEDIRQGIMDYRYYITLERLVRENNTADGEPGIAVAKGKALLDRIAGNVNVDIKHYWEAGYWDNATCQRLRWMLATAIEEIYDAKK